MMNLKPGGGSFFRKYLSYLASGILYISFLELLNSGKNELLFLTVSDFTPLAVQESINSNIVGVTELTLKVYNIF